MSAIEILNEALSQNTALDEEQFAIVKEEMADLHEQSVGIANNTFLIEAIVKNNKRLAQQLIELAAQINSPLLIKADNTPFNRNTPLLIAIKKGHSDLALQLIDKLPRTALDAVDANDFSSVQHAAILRNNLVLAALIRKGAKLNHSDSRSYLPQRLSAYDLYTKNIDEAELAYPFREQNRPSGVGRYFTRNPVYSDLHWHIADILTNQFQIQPANQQQVHLQGEWLRRAMALTQGSGLSYREALEGIGMHENPFARADLNTFAGRRRNVDLDPDIINQLALARRNNQSREIARTNLYEGGVAVVSGVNSEDKNTISLDETPQQNVLNDNSNRLADSYPPDISREEIHWLNIGEAMHKSIVAMNQGHWLFGASSMEHERKNHRLCKLYNNYQQTQNKDEKIAALKIFIATACQVRKNQWSHLFESKYGETKTAKTFFNSLNIETLGFIANSLEIELTHNLSLQKAIVLHFLNNKGANTYYGIPGHN